MADGEIVTANVAIQRRVEHGTFDAGASDGVGAVEARRTRLRLAGLLDTVKHARSRRIEASSDVLDVEDHGVEFLEHSRRHARAAVAVEAFDRAGHGLVDVVRDVVGVDGSCDPCSGARS